MSEPLKKTLFSPLEYRIVQLRQHVVKDFPAASVLYDASICRLIHYLRVIASRRPKKQNWIQGQLR